MLHQEPGALDYRDLLRAAIQLGAVLTDLREIARRRFSMRSRPTTKIWAKITLSPATSPRALQPLT